MAEEFANNISPSDTAEISIIENSSFMENFYLENSHVNDEEVFLGLTFIVTGFTDDRMRSLITKEGGDVLPSSTTYHPICAVVPLYGACLKRDVDEIVTELFIEDCVIQREVVNIKYYHKPLCMPKLAQLSRCVITISMMYSEPERKYLLAVANRLGATCQDTFTQSNNEEHGILRNSHLICPTAEGSKYKAAVRWEIPAVTADWLVTCATKLKRVNETPFLVGEFNFKYTSNNEINMQLAELRKQIIIEVDKCLLKQTSKTPRNR